MKPLGKNNPSPNINIRAISTGPRAEPEESQEERLRRVLRTMPDPIFKNPELRVKAIRTAMAKGER